MRRARGAVGLLGVLVAVLVASSWPSDAVSARGSMTTGDPVRGDLDGDGVARVVTVGDSIMAGAAPQIAEAFRSAGYEATVDAAVSRSTLAGADVVRAYTEMGADALVVMLGANDAGNPDTFRTRVRGVLDAAEGAPLVLWMSIPEVRDYYGPANEVLRQEVAALEGGSVLEWGAVAAADGVTAGDGLHLTQQGIGTMTEFVFISVTDSIDAEVSARQRATESSEPPGGHAGGGSAVVGAADEQAGSDPGDDTRSQGESDTLGRAADSIDSLVGPGGLLTAVVLVAGVLACGGIGVGSWSLSRTRRRRART